MTFPALLDADICFRCDSSVVRGAGEANYVSVSAVAPDPVKAFLFASLFPFVWPGTIDYEYTREIQTNIQNRFLRVVPVHLCDDRIN
jgi:hypothetical protein